MFLLLATVPRRRAPHRVRWAREPAVSLTLSARGTAVKGKPRRRAALFCFCNVNANSIRATEPSRGRRRASNRMLKNPFSPRLLKRAQMPGGAPGTQPKAGCRREAYLRVRRSAARARGVPIRRMGPRRWAFFSSLLEGKPDPAGYLPLAGVQREEGQLLGIGGQEQSARKMPQIGTLEASRCQRITGPEKFRNGIRGRNEITTNGHVIS